MKQPIITTIKNLVFVPPYIRLYPLSKKEGIVDKINSYDYNLDDDFVKDINSLYNFLLSDIEVGKLNIKTSDRNLDKTYKTKKIKHKDKETKIKTVEKVKIERKRSLDKEDREHYSKQKKELEEATSLVETLTDRLLSGEITDSDLPLLDTSLKNNRFRTSTYIAGIVAVVLIVIILLIML